LRPLDDVADYAGNMFVPILVTQGGIGGDLPFKVGKPVEIHGMFIAADEADPGPVPPR